MLSRDDLIASLPVEFSGLTFRVFERGDVDLRADWPEYPPPYSGFSCTWGNLNAEARDELFRNRSGGVRSIVLAVDHNLQRCAAYVMLREIDWDAGTIGNMGLRLHPDWCDRGIGTQLMRGLVDWCRESGVKRLRHDVCALNPRAVRCYEKAGYRITGEFWCDDDYWQNVPLDDPSRIAAEPHLRVENGVMQVRFWWMEVETEAD